MIQDLDRYLTPVAKKLNVGLINASPLHMGMLTKSGAPDWHPAPQALKKVSHDAFEYCQKLGGSLPEVALRFALDYLPVASTLVGMKSVAEVDRNLKTVASTNDPALLEAVQHVIGTMMNRTWPSGRLENSDALLLGIPQS